MFLRSEFKVGQRVRFIPVAPEQPEYDLQVIEVRKVYVVAEPEGRPGVRVYFFNDGMELGGAGHI